MTSRSKESGSAPAACGEAPRHGPEIELQMEELTQSTPHSILRAARELLLEYGRFVLAQPGAGQFCFGSLENEADRLPASFLHQGGGSLVALVSRNPAGFIAWRALTPTAAVAPNSWEVKRLWVRPDFRGFRLGRMLTQAVLDRAVTAGRKAVYLDTAPESMACAYRLYQEMGFRNCDRYNENPVEGLTWMVKSL